MPPHRRLTCPDVDQQVPCPTVCSVRIEGVRGKKRAPLTYAMQAARQGGYWLICDTVHPVAPAGIFAWIRLSARLGPDLRLSDRRPMIVA